MKTGKNGKFCKFDGGMEKFFDGNEGKAALHVMKASVLTGFEPCGRGAFAAHERKVAKYDRQIAQKAATWHFSCKEAGQIGSIEGKNLQENPPKNARRSGSPAGYAAKTAQKGIAAKRKFCSDPCL